MSMISELLVLTIRLHRFRNVVFATSFIVRPLAFESPIEFVGWSSVNKINFRFHVTATMLEVLLQFLG